MGWHTNILSNSFILYAIKELDKTTKNAKKNLLNYHDLFAHTFEQILSIRSII